MRRGNDQVPRPGGSMVNVSFIENMHPTYMYLLLTKKQVQGMPLLLQYQNKVFVILVRYITRYICYACLKKTLQTGRDKLIKGFTRVAPAACHDRQRKVTYM